MAAGDSPIYEIQRTQDPVPVAAKPETRVSDFMQGSYGPVAGASVHSASAEDTEPPAKPVYVPHDATSSAPDLVAEQAPVSSTPASQSISPAPPADTSRAATPAQGTTAPAPSGEAPMPEPKRKRSSASKIGNFIRRMSDKVDRKQSK